MTELSVKPAVSDPSSFGALDLPAFLRGLPAWPWPEPGMVLSRINSGLTNVNWRMTAPTGVNYFLKVPGLGTRTFIDRAVANTAASMAAERGIAPRVLYYDDVSGVEVSEFLEGYRSGSVNDLGSVENGIRLMQLYRTLHDGPLLPLTKTIFDMLDEHVAQIDASPRRLLAWQQSVVDTWMPVQNAFIAGGIDLVPGHNDMLPSNYMLKDGEDIKLIDYDYAANTERAYEPGGILTLYPLTDDVREAMLVSYFGADVTARDRARVTACGIATCVKWGLWGLVNATARPTEAFDFERYGCMHLMNAAVLLADMDLDELVEILSTPAP